MPNFRVFITKDLTQTAVLYIEAEDEDEAIAEALADEDHHDYELDEGNIAHAYISHIEEVE